MDTERTWIKVGPDPLRYEYGRENPDPTGAPITDQLAYVEEERSSYFHWETYTDLNHKGAAPDRKKAQAKAEAALRRAGVEASGGSELDT